jgi:hypothetical protein
VLESEGTEPACFDGSCPVWIDQLPPEALRAIGLRNLFSSLSDMGLAPLICEEYAVTSADLELLLFIAREEAELQQEIDEAQRGKE